MKITFLKTLFQQHHSNPIHRLYGAHAGGSDRDDSSAYVIVQMFNALFLHDDRFGVHLMLSNSIGSNRTERAGADVQCNLFYSVSLLFQFGYQRFGEM